MSSQSAFSFLSTILETACNLRHDQIVLASSIMLANILSSKRQFKEGIELYKAVGKNGRKHQDPMQQASCNPPKALVVIVVAIAGHR